MFDLWRDPVNMELSQSGFGYTGEWYQGYIELLHLRARWYMPETGTFLSRDAWTGNVLWSQTQNGWSYVENNPINLIDPSGYCPPSICRDEYGPFDPYYRQCAYWDMDCVLRNGPRIFWPSSNLPTPSEQAYHIFRSGSDNVTGLIRLFEMDGLPGCTAQERLDWILLATASMLPGSYVQFGPVVPQDGDSGFRQELADGKFYGNVWGDPGPSKQMGHFLTAVALGNDPAGAYYQSYIFEPSNLITDLSPFIFTSYIGDYYNQRHALDLIVGHEMLSDQSGIANIKAIYQQYHVSTTEARNHFLRAVDYDRDGRISLRDQELRAILVATNPRFENEDAIQGRTGNSMQDLRNSVKGFYNVGGSHLHASRRDNDMVDKMRMGKGFKVRKQVAFIQNMV